MVKVTIIMVVALGFCGCAPMLDPTVALRGQLEFLKEQEKLDRDGDVLARTLIAQTFLLLSSNERSGFSLHLLDFRKPAESGCNISEMARTDVGRGKYNILMAGDTFIPWAKEENMWRYISAKYGIQYFSFHHGGREPPQFYDLITRHNDVVRRAIQSRFKKSSYAIWKEASDNVRPNLWGFIDKSGRYAIEPRFTDASDFSEGLAAVEIGDLWGFVDRKGTVVIKPEYEYFQGDFSEGLVAARQPDGDMGYLDKKGKWAIWPSFRYAYRFSDGLAAVELKEGGVGFIDKTGKLVIPADFSASGFFENGRAWVDWQLIDKRGQNVLQQGCVAVGYVSEGLVSVRELRDEKSSGPKLKERYGFADLNGKIVIPMKFDYVWAFDDNRARYKDGEKVGFIDRSGRVVVKAKYDFMWRFSEGLAAVSLRTIPGRHFGNGIAWGYVNTDGAEVIPLELDYADAFSEGFAHVIRKGKHEYINKAGKPVIRLDCVKGNPFREGLAAVSVRNKKNSITNVSNGRLRRR